MRAWLGKPLMVGVLLVVWTALAVHAQIVPNSTQPSRVVYQYLGKPFTTAVPPYTTSSAVSATITVPSVLHPNLFYQDISSLGAFLSLSDGVQTIDSISGSGVSLMVSTDTDGNIVAPWLIGASSPNQSLHNIYTNNEPLPQPTIVTDIASFGGQGACYNNYQACSSVPGTWSTQGPDPVPMFPASGSVVYPTFTMSWTGALGATWYRIWLSTAGSTANILPCSFSGGSVDSGGCWTKDITLTLQSPLAPGTYRWWVKSWSAQRDGKWSAATSFLVAKTRFEDRGPTIFDSHTGLEWEKKTTDGSVHDVNISYSWSGGSPWNPDGTAFTVLLAVLNGTPCVSQSLDGVVVTAKKCPGFAGHSDWRLPGIDELKTIADCSFGPPCVNPIFGPTVSDYYWSSSSHWGSPSEVWAVSFTGPVTIQPASQSYRVRAVRGSTVGSTGGSACTQNVGGTIVVLPGCP